MEIVNQEIEVYDSEAGVTPKSGTGRKDINQ
jgi:hypothetical protein